MADHVATCSRARALRLRARRDRARQADFILIPGDPLGDIEILGNVSPVVQDGTIYFPAEICRALNIERFAPPPPRPLWSNAIRPRNAAVLLFRARRRYDVVGSTRRRG